MARGDGLRAALAHVHLVIERRNIMTEVVMKEYVTISKREMQSRIRWKKRTGNLSRTLQARVRSQRGGGRERHGQFYLDLGYGMSYGKWVASHNGPAMGSRAGMPDAVLLSRQNAGNLDVVWPTADAIWPRLRREVRARRLAVR